MSVSESGDPACLFPIMWLYGSYCSVMPQLGKTLVILVTGRRQLIDSCLDHLLSIQFISRSTSVPGCAGPWDTVFSLIAPLMRWVQQVKRQPQQKQQALHCALPLIIMFVFLPIWERFLWWSKVPFPLLSFPNSNFLRNIYSITISTNRFLPLLKDFFYWRHWGLTWPSGSPLLFFQRTRGQKGGARAYSFPLLWYYASQ